MWKVTMVSTEEALRKDGYGINIEWCENHDNGTDTVMRFVKYKPESESFSPYDLYIFAGDEEEEKWTNEKEWAKRNFKNFPSISQNVYCNYIYHGQNEASMSAFIQAIKDMKING